MRYLSVCSGIEAASVAWHPLGWTAAALSEIDPFARAVLRERYPETPLVGDMRGICDGHVRIPGAIDLLVGGTPCQGFSTAGRGEGLDDPRSGLARQFVGIARRLAPRWLVWENVPGALSTNGGRDFGSFLGALVELGYSLAYRVLDAQFFGVPQRRRRVFVVGHLGADWRRAAAVLFEPESLSGDSSAGGQARAAAPGSAGGGVGESGGGRVVAYTLTAAYAKTPVIGSVASSANIVMAEARCFHQNLSGRVTFVGGDGSVAGSVATRQRGTAENLTFSGRRPRRFSPRECERLQGFPDDWTRIPWRGKPAEECPASPRYKALGNSMAVPVMRWIGERIGLVAGLLEGEA